MFHIYIRVLRDLEYMMVPKRDRSLLDDGWDLYATLYVDELDMAVEDVKLLAGKNKLTLHPKIEAQYYA